MLIESLIEYFNNSDLDAPVFTEVPKRDIPQEYYVLELIGDPAKDHISTATIVIRSYAQSMKRAADLAYEIDMILRYGAITMDIISGIVRNTIGNNTDQTTKEYRYQGVYVITHY